MSVSIIGYTVTFLGHIAALARCGLLQHGI